MNFNLKLGWFRNLTNPLDALDYSLLNVSVISSRRFDNRPGAVIEKMPKDVRNALHNLTSDMTSKARVERREVGYGPREELSFKMQEFDEKIFRHRKVDIT